MILISAPPLIWDMPSNLEWVILTHIFGLFVHRINYPNEFCAAANAKESYLEITNEIETMQWGESILATAQTKSLSLLVADSNIAIISWIDI